MKIHKVLNNNVVVAKNENDQEIIAMGRGIAFKKKCGETIPEDMIDKVYTLADKVHSRRFQELLADIPIEHMELSDAIIQDARLTLGKNLNETIYISLTDHIYTAVTRCQNGITVQNPLLWDIRRFYPDEFQLGLKALGSIEKAFEVTLPEDEAGFIALHFVNAQMDEGVEQVYDITRVMQEILNIVKYHFKIEFDEDSVYYYRFVTHLKFFAQRLFGGATYQEDQGDGLFEMIREKYDEAYACVIKIWEFIEQKYNYSLSQEEQLYLTVHIERIIRESEKSARQ